MASLNFCRLFQWIVLSIFLNHNLIWTKSQNWRFRDAYSKTRWSPLTPARSRSSEELVGFWVPQEYLEAFPWAQFGRTGIELVLLLFALLRHRRCSWTRNPLPSARKGMQEDGRSRGLLRTPVDLREGTVRSRRCRIAGVLFKEERRGSGGIWAIGEWFYGIFGTFDVPADSCSFRFSLWHCVKN